MNLPDCTLNVLYPDCSLHCTPIVVFGEGVHTSNLSGLSLLSGDCSETKIEPLPTVGSFRNQVWLLGMMQSQNNVCNYLPKML